MNKQKKNNHTKPKARSEQDIIYANPMLSLAHAMVSASQDEEEGLRSLLIGHVAGVLKSLSLTGIFADDADERRLAQELTVGILDEYLEDLDISVVPQTRPAA